MEDSMATRTSAAKKPRSAPRARPAAKAKHEPDVIRIVPLHVVEEMGRPTAEAAGPAAAPHLTYRNGPLLANVEVFTLFWGAAWNGAQSAMRTTVNQFFDFVLTSALIDQLVEYNAPKFKIGHGRRTGTVTVTSPAPHHSVSDAALQTFLKAQIASNAALPKPGPNTLYFIYAPPGVRIIQGGSASCQAFCGYHNDIGGKIFYAVMPFPGCQGCRGNLSAADALTSTSSHELCEAITDAVPGQGWYDDANGEIGDICAWKTKTLGSFCVQLEWSNNAGKCL
jgi:hypothetical protein